MSPDQLEKFGQIRQLLATGYAKYDDVHKSADGLCEVSYPTAYGDDEGCGGTEASSLMIYSYALGPYRQHYFVRSDRRYGRDNIWYSPDPFGDAVKSVQKWLVELDERQDD